ncbi:DedA family protein [Alkalihalobacillus sp. LMS6]|uniref:DedA family protein n=1 Tax=Alkalihalobacillus sp. LMS6 TaxID=2924034 RepID=UPI0020CFFCA9|nr:DedA family protein [Alkalihalobacillus sp. LMS6]UTR05713.1 DedA family protein [Alkalihalobacillus sp. LMS6]
MDILKEFITQYGYVGVFFSLVAGIAGFPIPDEILLITLGYLSYIEYFHLSTILFICFIGSLSGMSVSYVLGTTLGAPFLEKYGPRFYFSTKKQLYVHNLFIQHGKWLLLIGFFIPGIRHLIGYVSGITRFHYKTYVLITGIGSGLWTILFIYIGYGLGGQWLLIQEDIYAHKMLYMAVLSFIFLSALISYLVYKHILHTNKKQPQKEDHPIS